MEGEGSMGVFWAYILAERYASALRTFEEGEGSVKID
jgi:hypothetical protein